MPTMQPQKTPAELGFYMPAEWHAHTATWLTWPKDPETWPGRIEQVERIYLELIASLAPHEVVNLLVDNDATEHAVRRRCDFPGAQNVRLHLVPTVDSWIRDYGPNFRSEVVNLLVDNDATEHAVRRRCDFPGAQNVRLHLVPTVDSWIRDYGPNFLVSRAIGAGAFNDWIFNAWGAKYEALREDDQIPRLLEPILQLPRFEPGIVLEGGAIDVNGNGCVLTTEQCLLNPNRNPQLSRVEIEDYLKNYLGVEKVLWLGEGIAGEDTDGNIYDISRFVAPNAIVCAVEDDPEDQNYKLLQDNLGRLKAMTDAQGRPFEIIRSEEHMSELQSHSFISYA